MTAGSADEGRIRLRRFGPHGPEVDPDEAYAVPVGTTWLRANMVSSADGAITGPDHKSAGVSSAGAAPARGGFEGASGATRKSASAYSCCEQHRTGL